MCVCAFVCVRVFVGLSLCTCALVCVSLCATVKVRLYVCMFMCV